MSLATDIQAALDIRKQDSPFEAVDLTILSTNIANAVANWLMNNSTSSSTYAGGTVATAIGAFNSWSLNYSLLQTPLYLAFIPEIVTNISIATAFVNGLSAMVLAGILTENAIGTSTAPAPITFTGSGIATGVPVSPSIIENALSSMEIVTSDETDIRVAELKRLQIMAESFADSVAAHFPAVTSLTGAGAVGIGTLTLTGQIK